MSKIGSSFMLVLLYLSIVTFFLFHQSENYAALNKAVYLIAPIVPVFAGLILLKNLGWTGQRASVIKWLWAGLILWFMGEISILYFISINQDTYPSIADLFFLTGYASWFRAVILEIRLFSVNWKEIDFSVLSTLGTVFFVMVLITGYIIFLGYDSNEGLLSNLTTVSWTISDLIIAGLALILVSLVWKYKSGSVRREWIWFIGAILVNFVADTIYSLNPDAISDGSLLTILLDSIWISGYFLFTMYFLQINKKILEIQSKASSLKNSV